MFSFSLLFLISDIGAYPDLPLLDYLAGALVALACR